MKIGDQALFYEALESDQQRRGVDGSFPSPTQQRQKTTLRKMRLTLREVRGRTWAESLPRTNFSILLKLVVMRSDQLGVTSQHGSGESRPRPRGFRPTSRQS